MGIAQFPSSLDETSGLLINAIEQVGDGVLLVDERNRILWLNAAAVAICGWPREELTGQNVGMLAPPEVRERYDTERYPDERNRMLELLADPHDIRLIRKDGLCRWISFSLSETRVGARRVHLVVFRDVTEQRDQQHRMRLLSMGLDGSRNAVVVTGTDGRIVYVNIGFTRLFGHSETEAMAQPAAELLSRGRREDGGPDDLADFLAGRLGIQADRMLYDRQGQPLWCSCSVNPILDEYGVRTNTVCIFTDITQTKIHEVLQHRVLDAMAHEAPLADVATLLCHEVERLAPQVLAAVIRVDKGGRLRPLAAPSLPEAYSQAMEGIRIGPDVGACGHSAFTGEATLVPDLHTHPAWQALCPLLPPDLHACWSTPIKSSRGQVIGTFAFYYHDHAGPVELHRRLVEAGIHLCALAMEREESRRRIRRLAFYDELTGLPNRALLLAHGDQAISAGEDGPLAVLFIDVDRFKQINDSLGHQAGNEFLRVLAQRLQAQTGHADIIGRLAGDEFGIVLPDCDARHAADAAERVQAALSQPLTLGGVVVKPSVTIGISIHPDNGGDMDTLLQRADMALHQAKADGRGDFRFFSETMNQHAQAHLALEAALRDALQNESLELHYQPQVRLRDGRLHGVEALARWRHPVLGTIPPSRFIPLAEECGMIAALGHWALRTACRQLAAWRRAGLDVPTVSVNLSPTCFHEPRLAERVGALVRDAGLQPCDLTIEITEEVVLDSHPETLRTLAELKTCGMRLSMDDFGTGYSSLSHLRKLPLNELKLDKSFVDDIADDPAARALTLAIMHIGESLGLDVVAEGVEDARQLALLDAQGYHVVQGYFYSPALAADELERWLRERVPAPAGVH